MIIVLLVLSILVTVISFIIAIKNDFESIGIFFSGLFVGVIGCFITLIMVVFAFLTADEISKGKYIDEKITMYQEENDNIEKQIDSLVQGYMKYESDTFSEFKSEDSITLVSLYPELKSDELVKNQISVYTDNNKKIKELKEKKIDVKRSKWFLYFGK